jgi:hypothetical protein
LGFVILSLLCVGFLINWSVTEFDMIDDPNEMSRMK